ncbi:MAG: SAM-dependent methyltransferase [Betaproteobacteria bacterium]
MAESRLILIPVDLTEEAPIDWMGAHLKNAVLPLRRFVVEHPKAARRFLKRLGLPLQDLQFEMLDEHSKPEDLERIAIWFQSPGDVGLLSEAGCPAIADPGAALVARAHQLGVPVVPLVGPSSIILALMACGLNGQRFAFTGYLPQGGAERDARIRELEERSRAAGETEIFIEAPYRNDTLFAAVIGNCKAETLLTIACDLTAPTEEIVTHSVAQWRRMPAPQLHKRPTVFLLLAGSANSANRRARPAHVK